MTARCRKGKGRHKGLTGNEDAWVGRHTGWKESGWEWSCGPWMGLLFPTCVQSRSHIGSRVGSFTTVADFDVQE
eukprot:347326-Chlamydomonas_euryale.AAC.1